MNVVFDNEYYTIKEVSEILKVSTQTIRNLIKKGDLDSFKVGWLIRIPRQEVEKLAKRRY
jgi:excisionase family DNA binding protein